MKTSIPCDYFSRIPRRATTFRFHPPTMQMDLTSSLKLLKGINPLPAMPTVATTTTAVAATTITTAVETTPSITERATKVTIMEVATTTTATATTTTVTA